MKVIDFKLWFDNLPTPVKIIVFNVLINIGLTIQELTNTGEMINWAVLGRTLIRFIVTAVINIITWKLSQLTPKEEEKARIQILKETENLG